MRWSNLKAIFRGAVLAIVLITLVAPLTGFDSAVPLAAASALALASGFPMMSRGFKKASALFLGAGAFLLFRSGSGGEVWLRASGSMTGIVAIVAVMQAFSLPLKLGRYEEGIRAWTKYAVRSGSGLFLLVTLATHVLTSFLNLGSVPVMVGLFEDSLRERVAEWKRFFAKAMTRGYVMAALWSPGAVNLYLVAQATGLSWSRLFLPGFCLALAAMLLSWLLEAKGETVPETASALKTAPASEPLSTREGAADGGRAAGRAGPGRALQLLAAVGGFIGVAAGLEAIHLGSGAGRTAIAGAIVAAAWTLCLIRRPGLGPALRSYWEEGLLRTADIAPFFVAMGLFSRSLEVSGLLEAAAPLLGGMASLLGGATIVPVSLLLVAAAMVGIHPFIGIVLAGQALAGARLELPRMSVALALSVGAASTYLVTPFAGVIMIISRSLSARAADVAFRWNWRYSALFFALGTLFAFAWGRWLG